MTGGWRLGMRGVEAGDEGGGGWGKGWRAPRG